MNYIKAKAQLVFFIFFALIFIGQFAGTIAIISKNVAPQGVIFAKDNDAGVAIRKAIKTTWYNDNTWRPYGPVYYRIAHTIARISPFSRTEGQESIEESHHFVLMLISLLSIYLIAFLLIREFTSNLTFQLFGVSALASAFLINPIWSNFILKVHPDILFSLMAGLSSLLTFKMMQNNDRSKFFIGSALLWGITASTKLSIVLFIPSFLFYFLPPVTKERLILTAKYAGLMMLGYFAIGFPQNFILHKSINFLIYQSQYSVAPTLESTREWLTFYFNQLWIPLVFLISFALIFREKNNSKKAYPWRFVVVTIIPILLLFSRKIISPHSYYTLPFVVTTLVLVASFLMKLKIRSLNDKIKYLFALILVFAIKYSIGLIPSALTNELDGQLKCRKEFLTSYQVIKDLFKDGKRLLVTPYIPYPNGADVYSNWDHTFDEIRGKKFDYFFLNKGFYNRYTSGEAPSEYTKIDTPSWSATRDFFLTFENKQKTQDPFGNVWQKEADNCSIEIWKKI